MAYGAKQCGSIFLFYKIPYNESCGNKNVVNISFCCTRLLSLDVECTKLE